jgi:hypothetical protein
MDERAPLLHFQGGSVSSELGDHHTQFCRLVGVKPVNHPHDEEHRPHPQSLYARAEKRRSGQSCTYMFTATLINTLLLTQVVLGAALTGLGASDSSRILITIFGALNTVIAGVIAFLKSRGQPMRARMFRDDLSRVVDEIENSAVMWYGISASVHGYDAIDTDDQVTVRGEVARLTRLYDKAVKTNTMNDPDMYSAGSADSYNDGLRKNALAQQPPPGPNIMASVVPPDFNAGAPVPPSAPAADPDASPASKEPEPPKTKEESDGGADKAASPTDTQKPAGNGTSNNEDATSSNPALETPKQDDKGKETPASAAPAPAASSAMAFNPDESPASAARVPTKEDSQSSTKTLVDKDKSVSA